MSKPVLHYSHWLELSFFLTLVQYYSHIACFHLAYSHLAYSHLVNYFSLLPPIFLGLSFKMFYLIFKLSDLLLHLVVSRSGNVRFGKFVC